MLLGKKIFIILIGGLTILCNLSAQVNALPLVNGEPKPITQNEPEMMASPEETIPVEIIERRMSKWEWILLGTLAVGALAAAGAAAGGGGGGDDGTVSQQPAGGSDTGNVAVSW